MSRSGIPSPGEFLVGVRQVKISYSCALSASKQAKQSSHRRQDKTSLSCLVRVGGMNSEYITADKTVLSCFVDPVSNFQVFSNRQYISLNSCKLENGSRQDKTVLSCDFGTVISFVSASVLAQKVYTLTLIYTLRLKQFNLNITMLTTTVWRSG